MRINQIVRQIILLQLLFLSCNVYALDCNILKNEIKNVQKQQFNLSNKGIGKDSLAKLEIKRDQLAAKQAIMRGIYTLRQEYHRSQLDIKNELQKPKSDSNNNLLNELIDFNATLENSIESTSKLIIMDSLMKELSSKDKLNLNDNEESFLNDIKKECSNSPKNTLCNSLISNTAENTEHMKKE